jgi:hypothetical protein
VFLPIVLVQDDAREAANDVPLCCPAGGLPVLCAGLLAHVHLVTHTHLV